MAETRWAPSSAYPKRSPGRASAETRIARTQFRASVKSGSRPLERAGKPAVMVRTSRRVARAVARGIDEAYAGSSAARGSSSRSSPSATAMPTRVDSTLAVTPLTSWVSSGEHP